MKTTADLMTLEQYAAHTDTDERYVTDLVRGVMVRVPRPGDPHGAMQIKLGRLLGNWAHEHGARVTGESGYILAEDPPTLRGPDLAVVVVPRSSKGQPGGWIRRPRRCGRDPVAVRYVQRHPGEDAGLSGRRRASRLDRRPVRSHGDRMSGRRDSVYAAGDRHAERGGRPERIRDRACGVVRGDLIFVLP